MSIRAYREPEMTRTYWRTVGGTLILEYPLVRAKRGEREARRVDGLICHDGPTQEAKLSDGYQSLAGRRVTVVQTKLGRIGMYLLGQARYSADLARALGAEVVATVAVCEANDTALAPFAERDGIIVWTTSAAQNQRQL